MVQTAKVTRLLPDGRAEVSVKRQSACGHDCSKCGGGCSELMVSSTVAVIAANFFVGYFVAAALGLPGGGSAGVGIAGFAVGILLAVLWDRRVRRQRAISFRITAIAAEA